MRFVSGSVILGLWLSGYAQAQSQWADARHWQGVALDRVFVSRYINPEKCSSSVSYLQACSQAVRFAAALVGKPAPDNDKINHLDVLTDWAKDIPKSRPHGYFWGMALNGYLKSFDKYARLEPRAQWEDRRTRQVTKDNRPNLEPSLQSVNGRAIGVITVRSFASDSLCSDFRAAYRQLRDQGARGLVVDLRDNPGGQRMIGVCIAGLFIGQNPVIGLQPKDALTSELTEWLDAQDLELSGNETSVRWVAGGNQVEIDLPTALLINERSASTTELLAGALKYYGLARVIGRTSFGKGVSQEWTAVRDHQDLMLARTVDAILLPDGLSPEGQGIVPDEDVASDSAMDRALNWLTEGSSYESTRFADLGQRVGRIPARVSAREAQAVHLQE